MSVTLLLLIAGAVTSLAVFADSLSQWSLRLLLDGAPQPPRRKAEPVDTSPTAEPPAASQPSKAA